MRFFWLLLLSGCSKYEQGSTPPTEDAGNAPDGGRPPPSAIFYVAGESGSDAAGGKTPQTPMRTIGNALGQGIDGAEIRICRGIYKERNLALKRNTVLRGGYNCTTWQRGTGFGMNGGFADTNNDTILEADPANEIPSALRIESDAVRDALIEGFTVNGAAPTATSEGTGIRVSDKANVAIEDCVVRGGAGTRSTPGKATVGIHVAGTAKGSIRRSRIEGGAGMSTDASVGSTGVLFTGEGSLEDSGVSGGAGRGGSGNHGVLVAAITGPVRILRNEVVISAGVSAMSAKSSGSSGVVVVDTNGHPVELAGNRVYGERQICELGCTAYGVIVSGAADARIEGNWVYSGTLATPVLSSTIGIAIDKTANAQVRNNVVVAQRPDAETASEYGIFASASGGDILHNTVINLTGGKNTGGNLALYIFSSRGQRVQNNAFYIFGAGAPIAFDRCPRAGLDSQQLTAFSNNAVAVLSGTPSAVWWEASASGECAVASSPTTSDAILTGHFAAAPTGNVEVTVATLEPGAEAGIPAATISTALRIAADPSRACAIAKKGADLRADVATDILGKMRSATPTIGALESDVANCP
jgi:hypothetical protein